MKRLTKENIYGFGHAKCSDACCVCDIEQCDSIEEMLAKLANYEDLEERIEKLFDGKISLAEAVDNIEKKVHGEENFRYSRILTNAEAEKWDKWLELEEQGRLITLPCKIGDTFYDISDFMEDYYSPDIYKMKADWITISKEEKDIVFNIDSCDYKLEDFGTILLPTEEAAWNKISELKGGGTDD